MLARSIQFFFGDVRMEILTLSRGASTDEGTSGELTGFGLSLFTLELPWRGNSHRISCIPSGQYLCRFCFSPAFRKDLYRLDDVPGRSGVLIHAGNWAGDVGLGLISNSQGCILLGKAVGRASGQFAVLNSAAAIRLFHESMNGTDFTLHITGGAA
jgi:hypothetical protein